jgi:peptidyl-prolyl cis-trans isomerase C
MVSRWSFAGVLGLALAAAGLAAGPARAAGLATPAPVPAAAPAAAPPAPTPAPPPAPALPPASTGVARVNGTELHLADVEAAQQSLPAQLQKLPLQQIYPILLDRLVDGELVAQAGRKEHLDQDPAVQRRLHLYEDHLIQQAYVEQLIKTAVTPDRLQARYQEFLKQTPPREEVHARQILVKTEPEAKSIIAQLDKGAPRNIRPIRAPLPAGISAISHATKWCRRSPRRPLRCRPAITPRPRSRPSSAGM